MRTGQQDLILDLMNPTLPTEWTYLGRKPGSCYRQLFVKDRHIAAWTLYCHFLNEEEPMTLEEIAAAYELPLKAVQEAIAYCQSQPPEIQEDWEADEALAAAAGMNDPQQRFHAKPKRLSAEERARLSRR